ncbi:MAG: hypothetical protein O2973_01765 [Gemmatimonadetes bacterium]|nr:hypothetical protein [Gemmatimonadota bacterium]
MADALSRWRGKYVTVFYADRTLAEAEGKMSDVDTSGIVVDLPGGRTFIPYVAVLHIVGPKE